jgi:uncharacterized protein (TIGR01732 family)
MNKPSLSWELAHTPCFYITYCVGRNPSEVRGMGYGYGGYGYGGGYGNTFVLIVVLFILLIIVGASFYN